MASTPMAAHDRPRGRESADEGTDATAPRPAFDAIYEEYFDFVWRCARRFGIPADAIDDVVQDVFLAVHTGLERLERPGSLQSWLYGIVRRTASTYHRSRSVRAITEADSPAIEERASPSQPSPLDLAVLNDEFRLLWELLGELDTAKREVLILCDVEGMSVPEIAQATETPLNTVYSRLRAARHEFEEALARQRARQDERRVRRLSPAAAALLREGLGALQPSPADRERVRSAIQAKMGRPPVDPRTAGSSAGSATLGLRVSPWGWALVGAPVVGLAIGLWTVPGAGKKHARALSSPTVVVAEAAGADSQSETPSTPGLERTASTPTEGSRSVPATGSDRPATQGSRSAPGAGSDPLSDEVALLARATHELNAGHADAALRTLAEHERRFPAGALAEERAVTRAHALCAAGRTRQGKAELEKLERAHPRSPYLERAGTVCGVDSGPSP
jgi:RNA polymerase sigma-70 factor (ECF subfamily)